MREELGVFRGSFHPVPGPAVMVIVVLPASGVSPDVHGAVCPEQ
jgi:hypothetical protein